MLGWWDKRKLWYQRHTWLISDGLVRCVKSRVLISKRCEYHFNWIPRRVHWRRSRRTIQLEWLHVIIRSNICDGNTVSSPPAAHFKVMEGDFDDVPTGNCDTPGISAVLRKVVWKIGAVKESTWSIKKFLRSTSCKKLISLVLIIIIID